MSDATDNERWLPIPGYEGLYEVSDMGRVRNTQRLLKLHNANGYERVELCTTGRSTRKNLGVHRLVLLAFVGPPPPGHECRHIDGTRANNRLTNLAWGTLSENERDKVRHGTHHHTAKTACPAGHAYDHLDARGRRICRPCHREADRRYRARKANAGEPAARS